MSVLSDVMHVVLDAVQGGSTPRRQRLLKGKVVYTTSGAVDTTNSESPRGVTPTKPAGTGLYRLTCPAGFRYACILTHYDVSGGADGVTGKTITSSTGVIDFTVTDGAGSAKDAVSGDYTSYILVAEC